MDQEIGGFSRVFDSLLQVVRVIVVEDDDGCLYM